MRYHKYRYSLNKWLKLKKWDPLKSYKKGYLYYDELPSSYYVNQTYGALNKCWLGFVIAKEKGEYDKLEMYARRIQKLERQLERDITDFSNWGIE
ncbi:MAG TPA: hypothetical protein VFM28_11345 [Nitrososphaeraceae archaeon]|jgi:hypothetical protein|nr:hypothetical protein [Nitrososphaeraceae archaeon]